MALIGLALTLGAGLGCASRGAAPAAPEEAPMPGDPAVTLLDPGKAPRSRLRYRIAAAAGSPLVLDMDMSMALSLAGKPMPPTKIPTIRMVMSVEVPEVAADGTARLVSTITAVDVVAGPNEQPMMVERLKQEMAAMVGMKQQMRLTPRGLARDVSMDIPANLNPQVQQLAESLRTSLQQCAALFPAEEIGNSARWTVRSKLETSVLKLDQTATYTLDRLEGDRAFLTVQLAQSAPSQPMRSPGMPAGTTATLERYSGNGQGKMELRLVAPIPRSTLAIRSDMASTVATGDKRSGLDMQMQVAMKIGPGQTP